LARVLKFKKGTDVAIVGGESLIGREVIDVCQTSDFPSMLSMIADDDKRAGVLTEEHGEPVVIGRLDAATLGEYKVTFLAGSPDSARMAASLDAETVLIDLTGAAEESDRARLRAPSLEPKGYTVGEGSIHVVAHPAAIMLATVLNRLHLRFHVQRAVATVFLPASAHGKDGLDELQQQTVSLLSFKSLPKAVFDTQAAFNLLASYGEDAPVPLETIEQRIERHLASLLEVSSRAPLPSLRVIHAPTFHGLAASLWVELEEMPGAEAIGEILGAEDPPPNNVSIAGQKTVATGGVAADRGNPRACWIWIAGDNLRIAAEEAVDIARALL
jgi:aspartate-semialdehyde dehydrogenase